MNRQIWSNWENAADSDKNIQWTRDPTNFFRMNHNVKPTKAAQAVG